MVGKQIIRSLFFCCVFFVASTVVGVDNQSFSLDCVNQNKIDEHKKNIDRSMTRHKYLRIALQAGAGAIALYGCYRFFAGNTKNTVSLPTIPNPSHSFTPEQYKKILELIENKQPKENSGSFVRSVFSFIHRYVLPPIYSTVVLSVGQKLLHSVFHDDTIAWFAEEKTTVARLRALIISHTKKINDETHLSDEQRTYLESVFVGMGQSLVQQVEMIAAFMEYQLEEYKKRGAVFSNDELLHVSHLIVLTNNFVSSLLSLQPVDGDTITREQLEKMAKSSQQFILDLCQLIECFIGVEERIELRLA